MGPRFRVDDNPPGLESVKKTPQVAVLARAPAASAEAGLAKC
jgi:hypothetical protein